MDYLNEQSTNNQNDDDVDPLLINNSHNNNDNQNIQIVKKSRYYGIEPALLLVFFTFNFSGTVFDNLIIYQSCTVKFGYNETMCRALEIQNKSMEIDDIESIVQPFSAKLFMARDIISGVIPAIVCLFIGPWSDKYGRKPVILTSLGGYFIIYLTTAVISFISTQTPIDPWFYLIVIIPVSCFGGICAFLSASFCYITDISNDDNRPRRMARVEIAIFSGLILGSLSSSYVYAATSTTMVFIISSAAIFLAIIYAIFFIEESINSNNNNVDDDGDTNNYIIDELEMPNGWTKFKRLFNFKLVTNMFYTCFKRRENLNRCIIWLAILSISSTIFAMGGTSTVYYLFVRAKFKFTLQNYTIYNAIAICIQIIGNIFGILVLNKLFGWSPAQLAILAYVGGFGDYLTRALAVYSWHLYLGAGLALLKSLTGPMCRSILAQYVPSNEIGKIFALTTSIESISPLIASPLYAFVYTNTLQTFPGAFNFISSGLYLICIILLSMILILQKTNPPLNNYSNIVNN